MGRIAFIQNTEAIAYILALSIAEIKPTLIETIATNLNVIPGSDVGTSISENASSSSIASVSS